LPRSPGIAWRRSFVDDEALGHRTGELESHIGDVVGFSL
jgi:hypothetical protein